MLPWVSDIQGAFYEFYESYEPTTLTIYEYQAAQKIQAAWRRHRSKLVLPIKRMSNWIDNILDGN